MLAAKKSAAQIGLELNRNAEAVYARVQRLRLKSKSPHDRLSGLSFSRRSAAQTMAFGLSNALTVGKRIAQEEPSGDRPPRLFFNRTARERLSTAR
jgi:hypothetical protein